MSDTTLLLSASHISAELRDAIKKQKNRNLSLLSLVSDHY